MAQKIIEVVGTSQESFAKAAENAVAEAGLRYGIAGYSSSVQSRVRHRVDLPRTGDATRSARAALPDKGQKLVIPCLSRFECFRK